MSREAARMLAEVRGCTRCASVLPVAPRPVLQVHPDARILIASQAPGRVVHETGIPFDDASGERLRGWLGVSEREFYDETRFAIVPMGFCYPGTGRSGDLPPRPECAPMWRASVLAMLTRIELTVAIGRYAVAYHTGGNSLTPVVRDWRQWAPGLIPAPHPSPRNTHWLRAHPFFEDEVLPFLRRRVRAVLGAADGSTVSESASSR